MKSPCKSCSVVKSLRKATDRLRRTSAKTKAGAKARARLSPRLGKSWKRSKKSRKY